MPKISWATTWVQSVSIYKYFKLFSHALNKHSCLLIVIVHSTYYVHTRHGLTALSPPETQSTLKECMWRFWTWQQKRWHDWVVSLVMSHAAAQIPPSADLPPRSRPRTSKTKQRHSNKEFQKRWRLLQQSFWSHCWFPAPLLPGEIDYRLGTSNMCDCTQMKFDSFCREDIIYKSSAVEDNLAERHQQDSQRHWLSGRFSCKVTLIDLLAACKLWYLSVVLHLLLPVVDLFLCHPHFMSKHVVRLNTMSMFQEKESVIQI